MVNLIEKDEMMKKVANKIEKIYDDCLIEQSVEYTINEDVNINGTIMPKDFPRIITFSKMGKFNKESFDSFFKSLKKTYPEFVNELYRGAKERNIEIGNEFVDRIIFGSIDYLYIKNREHTISIRTSTLYA